MTAVLLIITVIMTRVSQMSAMMILRGDDDSSIFKIQFAAQRDRGAPAAGRGSGRTVIFILYYRFCVVCFSYPLFWRIFFEQALHSSTNTTENLFILLTECQV
jgi:hypothetical protein